MISHYKERSILRLSIGSYSPPRHKSRGGFAQKMAKQIWPTRDASHAVKSLPWILYVNMSGSWGDQLLSSCLFCRNMYYYYCLRSPKAKATFPPRNTLACQHGWTVQVLRDSSLCLDVSPNCVWVVIYIFPHSLFPWSVKIQKFPVSHKPLKDLQWHHGNGPVEQMPFLFTSFRSFQCCWCQHFMLLTVLTSTA